MVINILEMIGYLGDVYYVIIDPTGEEAVFAARVRVGPPEADDFIYLGPGETTSQSHILTMWYFIPSTPGEYTVHAIYRNYHDPGNGEEAWKGEITSNVVHFTIEP